MINAYMKNIGGVWFGVVSQGECVVATNFSHNKKCVSKILSGAVQAKTPIRGSLEPSAFAEKVFSIMKSVYDGRGTEENIPLFMDRLTTYRQRILRTVAQIPVGYVTSYGNVADAAGGGARAVGNVMADNPFVPLVPCHRVVTSSMGLGGYGGNLRVKFELLGREKRGFDKSKDIVVENGILKVSPVEFVLNKLENRIFLEKTLSLD